MGFTHYWTIKRTISRKAWLAIAADTRKLLAATVIPIAAEFDRPNEPPDVTSDLIVFNGVGEEGHETFYFTPHKSGFEFCKTAQKPYDLIVTALLIVAAKHAGKAIEVSSDGDCRDWLPGLAFVRQILGPDYNLPLAPDGTVEDSAAFHAFAANLRKSLGE